MDHDDPFTGMTQVDKLTSSLESNFLVGATFVIGIGCLQVGSLVVEFDKKLTVESLIVCFIGAVLSRDR